jgi:hypothetical protein
MAAHAQSLSQMRTERAGALKNWAHALALQAATWGSPLVTMYHLRYVDAVGPNAKARPNEIWRMEDISTPELSVEAGYVTPNVNVIYGFGFLDLRQGPVVVDAPDSDGRYYMVEIVDMWTNAFAYIGERRIAGGLAADPLSNAVGIDPAARSRLPQRRNRSARSQTDIGCDQSGGAGAICRQACAAARARRLSRPRSGRCESIRQRTELEGPATILGYPGQGDE